MAQDSPNGQVAQPLSPAQTKALFDILTHYETYDEIASFKTPDAIANYGYPFTKGGANGLAKTDVHRDEDRYSKEPSTSPILQMLLSKFIMKLPGMLNLSDDFWTVRAQGLMTRFGNADLSESYDKAAMGTRKVLATASSSVIEMLSRGALGGLEEKPTAKSSKYKLDSATDLEQAWNDVLQGLTYGDLVDQLFDHFKATADFDSHSPMVGAAVKCIAFRLATLLHQVFVRSPDGQYLLKMIENVQNLVPYMMIKQTLKIGNAATMINGLMNLLLAKLSVASVTNWIGITKTEDDGMNLLQRIMSAVLSWDADEFKQSADAVKKAKDGPTPEMLETLEEFIDKHPREELDALRMTSLRKGQSIVTVILKKSKYPELTKGITSTQHAMCLQYYSALLSVRDRKRLSDALCKTTPDMFTDGVRQAVKAYDPIIRTVHQNVDLGFHLGSLQTFIDELIKTSKPKKVGSSGETQLPSVEDYVDLLMGKRHLLFNFIHDVGSKSPDIWAGIQNWSNESIVKFRKRQPSRNGATNGQNGSTLDYMGSTINQLYASLDEPTQQSVLKSIDAHSEYLDKLNRLSIKRFSKLVESVNSSNPKHSNSGPGVYLARWEALMDETFITPARKKGDVRRGKEVKYATTAGKTGVGGASLEAGGGKKSSTPDAPDVTIVMRALGKQFKRVTQEVAAAV